MLLIDRPCELGPITDYDFNSDVANNNQDSDTCDGDYDRSVVLEPLTAMILVVQGEFKILSGLQPSACEKIFAEAMKITNSDLELCVIVDICSFRVY